MQRCWRKCTKKKMIWEEKIRLQVSRCCFPTHSTNQRRRHKNVYNDQRMLRQELRFVVIVLPWIEWMLRKLYANIWGKLQKKMMREEKIRLQVSKFLFPTHNTNQRRRHKNVYNNQRMLMQELRFVVIAIPWTEQMLRKMYANFWRK